MPKRATKGRPRPAQPDPAPVSASAMAAVAAIAGTCLVVDAHGKVEEASGWDEAIGTRPPDRLPSPDAIPMELVQGLAAIVDEARRCAGTVRRIVSADLDRHRYYCVAAGPLAPGAAPGRTAALVQEITDCFDVGPKEGDAIRQLAHDLRTPLTSMSGAVELLQSGRLGQVTTEQGRLLGMLQKGLQMMLTLIDDASAQARAAQARAAGRGHAAV